MVVRTYVMLQCCHLVIDLIGVITLYMLQEENSHDDDVHTFHFQ